MALEGHAFLDFGREQRPLAQKHQALVEVAEGFFRFEVQVDPCPGLMALQGEFDLLEEIVAPNQELDRFVEHIEFFAKSVFQRPGECDDALRGNFHRRIVAACIAPAEP